MTTASFPALRMRRGRSSAWMRAMLAEHRLHPSDFIWPLFICEGRDCEEPIGSLPGVSRWSVDRLAGKAREAAELGIPCVALFPNTPNELRTDDAREALNKDNLICRAIRAIKDAVPEIGVLTDVALDPYTVHGHDGLVDELGNVVNDDTVSILVDQALVQADAGADIVAPSDMMDGRVAAIRGALESAGHQNVAIMAYAAKYASAFYGPFREAVGSQGRLKGDKRGYQMDPANIEEALREVELDLAEGADFVMVKPGMPYLDVVARVKEAFGVPTFAYQVSEGRHSERFLHPCDDVEIGHPGLDHDEVGPLCKVELDLAQRLLDVGRIHLITALVALEPPLAADRLAERAIEGRGVFRRIGHDRDILVPGRFERPADCSDATVHHVGRSHDVRAGIGLDQGLIDQDADGVVVDDIAEFVDQPIMAMHGIRIEGDVGQHADLGDRIPDRADRT